MRNDDQTVMSRQGARTLRRGAAVTAWIMFATTSGCAGTAPQASESRADGRTAGGPLSATLDVGGNAVRPPGVSPWKVSFGHYVLCSIQPGADITVEKVTITDVPFPPQTVEVWLRTVSQSDFPASGRIPTPLQPFYSARGAAPAFAEPYADPAAAGRFSRDVAGTEVLQTCKETKERTKGYQELVFTFEVDDEGARVDSFTIDYTADGSAYRLPVSWNMVACGTDIEDANICN